MGTVHFALRLLDREVLSDHTQCHNYPGVNQHLSREEQHPQRCTCEVGKLE